MLWLKLIHLSKKGHYGQTIDIKPVSTPPQLNTTIVTPCNVKNKTSFLFLIKLLQNEENKWSKSANTIKKMHCSGLVYSINWLRPSDAYMRR